MGWIGRTLTGCDIAYVAIQAEDGKSRRVIYIQASFDDVLVISEIILGGSPTSLSPPVIGGPQILHAAPLTSFAHHWCGPNNGPVLPDLSRDKGLSNIWAIIRLGNIFPPKATSATLLGVITTYSD
ncbi:hypothetical protein TNIN_207771 [Trichonephila inaurata madagascariensis]|uniref:Uncharacterized protein n=1 Tax=Trichonephila inaurata madagascariensis TaxID=2747483 RepID=A0A8X6WRE8_9ARAC|nr:hypothetical protein TNIN_207771 [Trichonephila inaurata madagascariensis]